MIECLGRTSLSTWDIWRRRLVFPAAIGCEPGQVRKEAAAAAMSGAGVGLVGAASTFFAS